MFDARILHAQLPHDLAQSDLPGLGPPRRGKVRDCYAAGGRFVMVATDRLSAFDRVLTTIPFKGRVLTALSAWWFEATRDVVANHLVDVPHPNVMVCRRCEPLPVEFVVRGYITGSLWRDYAAGHAGVYEVALPPGLRRDERLPRPILTPSTKAEQGRHDEPTSRARIVAGGAVAPSVYDRCAERALALYERGAQRALERGLILVDTKYEFGIERGEVRLIDEIHTPDSSRFWLAGGYAERLAAGAPQQMVDKEIIRAWLMERGFRGDGEPPHIPEDVRVSLAQAYIDCYERLTGASFVATPGPVEPSLPKTFA